VSPDVSHLYPEPRFLPAGDAALTVEVGEGISPLVNRRVHALDRALRQNPPPGLIDLVPAYRSLLVLFDPLVLPVDVLRDRITRLVAGLPDEAEAPRRVVEIPTCYGGGYGPDLAFVAAHAGLAEAEVIAIHAGTDYLVYMMGFSPGFTYLGGLSERIATPRLGTPRTAIPAGSVGIAQRQTGIYPVESPGGWQLIGRTPIRMFDPSRTPPTRVEPGDLVRFVPIDEATYRQMRDEERAMGGQP
jgi:inhibitor of KinA